MGTVKQEDQLERIAAALEAISSTMERMEQSLDSLTSVLEDAKVENPYGSAIAITGMIQQI